MMVSKHYKYWLILLLVIVSNKVISQEDNNLRYFTFSIGKATDNSFTKSKPAQVIATFPNAAGIDDSYLIDGYFDLSYTLERTNENVFSSMTSFGAFYEMHKNTLVGTAKEQDVRQYGLSFNHTWGAIREFDDPFNTTGKRKESLRDYVFSGSIRRSIDRIKKENSFQAIVGFKINRLRSKKSADEDDFYFLNATEKLPRDPRGDENETHFTDFLQVSYDYNVGLGYIENEDVVLGNLDLQFNAYPLSKFLQRKFKQEQLLFVSYSYSARGQIFGDLESDGRPYRTLTYGLEFGIGKGSKIQLAYNTIKGANPYKGLVYQDYSTMDLKVKFSIDTRE